MCIKPSALFGGAIAAFKVTDATISELIGKIGERGMEKWWI